MKVERLPSKKEVYEALEGASSDIYGFAMVCHSGVQWMAEPAMLDTLLLGLENFWFMSTEDSLDHREFRVEFFRTLWKKCQGKTLPAGQLKRGTDIPLGQEEMKFFTLPQSTRAILYLRTKKNFSYRDLAQVFDQSPEALEIEVEKAREFLLGHRLEWLESAEDEF